MNAHPRANAAALSSSAATRVEEVKGRGPLSRHRMLADVQAVRALPARARVAAAALDAHPAVAVGVDVARLGHAATPERFGCTFGVHGASRSAARAAVHDAALTRITVALGPDLTLAPLVAVGRRAAVRVAGSTIGGAHEASTALEPVLAGTRATHVVDALIAVAAASGRTRWTTLARQAVRTQARLEALVFDAAFCFAALIVVFAVARRIDAEAATRD